MNYDTIPFHEILFQLGITGWTLKKLPNNEEEFLAYFEIAIPHSDGVGIQYSNDSSKFGVTWDQIVAKKEELETAYTNNKYQRDRLNGISGSFGILHGTGSKYPEVGEQLDMLFHELETTGSLSISGSWFNTIKAVKDANPKP